MSRLLLVEGIPGSGKTTTARRLADLLGTRGQRCVLFLEGDPQPGDLAWQWWLTPDEFTSLVRRWPRAADTLTAASWQGEAGVSVAYNRLEREPFGEQWSSLEHQMAGREPFNGAVPPERLVEILAARWVELGRLEAGRPGFVVMECALLQNTLGELVLYAQWDVQRIAEAVHRVASGVRALSPLLVRLVTSDIRATVAAAAAERVDGQGHPWWREAVDAYMAQTPWARTRGIGGEDALIAYLGTRLDVEDGLRPTLPVDWMQLDSPAGSAHGWQGFEAALTVLADRLVGD